jgi:hypothetical protein
MSRNGNATHRDERLSDYELDVLREDAVGRTLEVFLLDQRESHLSAEGREAMERLYALDRKLAEDRQSELTHHEMTYLRHMTDGCPSRLSRKLDRLLALRRPNPPSVEAL